MFFCDLFRINPVYKGERQIKDLPKEENKMFKSMIAAALISMMSGNTAVSNINTLGGYTLDEEAVCETNEVEYKEKFDEAIAGVIGCDYEVSRLHEVQIVNGTNYIFSAYRTPAYPGAKAKLVQVTVHESLDGEISVLEIRDF